jgi:hypothetical protein
MNFQQKYIKYKKKYLKLKKIQEGGIECDLAYQNIHGTCWMVATITCICFGHVTSDKLEKVMNSFKINDQYKDLIEPKKNFIEEQIKKIKSDRNLSEFFSSKYCYIDENNIIYLKKILDKFIDRYYSKVFRIKNLEKPDISPELNTERCELVIEQNFKKLFNTHMNSHKLHGGNIVDNYIFANLLSIFFFGCKLYFKNYFNDIDKIEISRYDIGILILTDNHVCCLFVCDKKLKYYNDIDKKILNCKSKILKSNINNLYIQTGEGLISIDIKSYKGNKKTLSKVSFLTVISRKENSNFNDDLNRTFSGIGIKDIKDPEIQNIIGNQSVNSSSYKNAIEFYEKSASQFHTYSAYELGSIYENGIVVPSSYIRDGYVIDKDYVKAFKNYKLAADQGFVRAQNKLGEFYENGYGIPKDYCNALEYYQLAADQGDEDAQDNLKRLLP